MQASDWFQITLTLVGFILGTIVSWILYRTQQKTDFDRLREVVDRIGTRTKKTEASVLRSAEVMDSVLKAIGGLNTSAEVGKRIDNLRELRTIRSKIDGINVELNKAVREIIGEVHGQQKVLSDEVEKKFQEQSKEAIRVIEKALRSGLKDAVPVQKDREELLTTFVDLIERSIGTMGKFQRLSIDQQSSFVLATVENKVTSAIDGVVHEVKDLKEKVEELPRLLAGPRMQSQSLQTETQQTP